MVKPSIAQITEYCKERGNSVDPVAFFHHYDAIGWVRACGKALIPIVKWKSVVIQWERRTTHPIAAQKREERCIKEKKEQFVPRKKKQVNPEIKKLSDEAMALGKMIPRSGLSGRSKIKKQLLQINKDIKKLRDQDTSITRILKASNHSLKLQSSKLRS